MMFVCVCLCAHAHECAMFVYDIFGTHLSTEPRTRPHLTQSKGKTASLLKTLQWLPLELDLTPHQGPRDLSRSGFCPALSLNQPPRLPSLILFQLWWSLVCSSDITTSYLLNNLHCYSLCPAQLTANSTWLGSMGPSGFSLRQTVSGVSKGQVPELSSLGSNLAPPFIICVVLGQSPNVSFFVCRKETVPYSHGLLCTLNELI